MVSLLDAPSRPMAHRRPGRMSPGLLSAALVLTSVASRLVTAVGSPALIVFEGNHADPS